MSGPDIYVVTRCTGDGYGHGDKSCVSWFFSKEEAEANAKQLGTGTGYWHEVEEVTAGTPMPERERW